MKWPWQRIVMSSWQRNFNVGIKIFSATTEDVKEVEGTICPKLLLRDKLYTISAEVYKFFCCVEKRRMHLISRYLHTLFVWMKPHIRAFETD